MKFNQLRDFVAVAEAGSLRAASRRLELAQPAITRSIQELENSLGAQLFIRGARGVRLTPVGMVFLVRARNVLEEVRRAGEEVSQIQGSAEGNLVVGLSIAGHMGVLERVLRPFIRRYPRVRLHVIEGFLPTLESELLAGTVDFFIGPVSEDIVTPELDVSKLFDNERLVIARRDHPRSASRSLSDLNDVDWLTTSITHDAKDELSAVFAEHGLPPPRLIAKCQSALSILTFLMSTDMLAMVPRQWVESPLMKDLLIPFPLKERFGAPPICLVHRKGLGLTPAAEHFVTLVRKASSAPLPGPR
ncbi:LysR substrate-binding domain-containing protein [Roseobacter sp. GAI101]|uniref:LysR substrate-binding domain-containing protein n=1 Tax=Roseobacter sp. (strain GAI101) TaxID=391589 RepID=UPI0001871F0A|nr:LysR substrate-binding domain-containing protein [Roseobacter sp. GAI101]EEB82423.1 transcriptional regulator, LysR family [Roseobacter sp. GAI101]